MTESSSEPRFERFLAHAGWVRRLARSLIRDPNQVDDVVQETWVAALEQNGFSANDVRDDRAFLGGVFRNVIRQTRRSDARRAQREAKAARAERPLPDAAELVEQADQQARVIQAVVQLHEPYRSTLLMRYFEDLSAEEIATRLSLPSSTVRNRVRRGLDLLRERFDREHDGDRRAWCLGLIPIAIPKGEVGAATAALATSATKGVLSMSLQALAATTALTLLGWGTSVVYHEVTDPEPVTLAIAADPLNEPAPQAQEPERQAGLTAPVPATQEQDEHQGSRQPVPVPTDEPTELSGRVVDQNGDPVADATVFIGAYQNPFAKKARAGWRLAKERADGFLMEVEEEKIAREMRLQQELDLERVRAEAAAERAEKKLPPHEEHSDQDLEQRKKAEKKRAEAEKKERAEKEKKRAQVTEEEREREEQRRRLEAEERRLVELKRRAERVQQARDVARSAELAEMGESLEILRRLGYIEADSGPVPDFEMWAEVPKEKREQLGILLGRTVRTDENGYFRAKLDRSIPVYVAVHSGLGLHRPDGSPSGVWVADHAEKLTIEMRTVPVAQARFRLVDRNPKGSPIVWSGVVSRAGDGIVDWERQEVLEQAFELNPDVSGPFTVTIRQPEWARTSVEFELSAGEMREVPIEVDSSEGLGGLVVDHLGQPVSDAVVYWGVGVDIRGNTIFGTYNPEHVWQHVKSAADGTFHLPGEGAWVSAWHPAHSPVTVRSEAGARLQLAARGTIEGRAPLDRLVLKKEQQAFVRLDRQRAIPVAADGTFRIENVEAGVHGLSLGKEDTLGVVVRPGETTRVDWEPFVPVTEVELRKNGAPYEGRANGYVVGVDPVFGISPFALHSERLPRAHEEHALTNEVAATPTMSLFELRMGSYVLYTSRHEIALFDVRGAQGVAEIGAFDLKVTGKPGTQVYLVPDPWTENAIVRRVASLYPREISDRGTARFSGLPAGRYGLFDTVRGLLTHVYVEAGAEVTLP